MSGASIANRGYLSRGFVANMRKVLTDQGVNGLQPETRVGVDGKTYPVRPKL